MNTQVERNQQRKRERAAEDRATRASWRAAIVLLTPLLIGGGVTTALHLSAGRIDRPAVIAAAATAAVTLAVAPITLWWSASALRRGTRRIVLSVLTGFASATLTVALAASAYAAAAGWTLLTREPLPGTDYRLELPGGLR